MVKFEISRVLNTYADGSENAVMEILSNSRDRSTGSDELQNFCTDWPKTYHFSGNRTNLLRPFRFESGRRILEIGGGTGILSQYLADEGLDVTVIEGELSRGLSAKSRMENCENVRIVIGDLTSITDSEKFDYILVVGVLEYIPIDQVNSWLTQLNSHLTESGTLILAIENRIGLKYWLGFPEDHTGVMWDGIRNYSNKLSPHTYTKNELTGLLEKSGFRNTDFLSVWPDYKLPTAIIREVSSKYLTSEEMVSLIKNPFEFKDYTSKVDIDFLAILKTMIDSKLFIDFSNSFLVTASKSNNVASEILSENEIGWFFNLHGRKRDFRICRKLLWIDKELFWQTNRINHKVSAANIAKNSLISQTFKDKLTPFVKGSTLSAAIKREMENERFDIALILLRNWSKSIELLDTGEGINLSQCGHKSIQNFDISLDNWIIEKSGKYKKIDDEWISEFGFCENLLKIRSLVYFLNDNPKIDLPYSKRYNKWKVARNLLKDIEELRDDHTIKDSLQLENAILNEIHVPKFSKKEIRKLYSNKVNNTNTNMFIKIFTILASLKSTLNRPK
jgi:2-polyprenyl-3-methyl-5-hydroxy-6-metoxy-1,4-benzoquinol methylase